MRPALYALLLAAVLLFAPRVALAAVDVNTATQSQLETLPGIGPSKAIAILEFRNTNGPFKSMSDLDKVPGIGPSTLANLNGLVSFGEGAAPASNAPAAPAAPASTGGDAEAPPPAPRPASSGSGVNINTASASELQKLPGIGPSKAAAIIADRDTRGAFKSCADLDRVQGIGPATVAGLADACRTE